MTVIGAGSPARPARGEGAPQRRVFTVPNELGKARTINVADFPVLAVDNPFFLDLGVNGRRCSTCHEPQSNMTVTPARLRARFDATDGHDPIFRPNDGSNSPLADTSTVETRRAAYSMLLTQWVGRDAPRYRELLRPAIQPGTSEQQKAELVAFLRTL